MIWIIWDLNPKKVKKCRLLIVFIEMSVGFVFSVAPSKGHEILSRKVENDIVEFWYYMRFSLKSIRDLAVGNTMLINRVDEVLSDGLDYKRYLPKLIHLFIFFFFLFFFLFCERPTKLIYMNIGYTTNINYYNLSYILYWH